MYVCSIYVDCCYSFMPEDRYASVLYVVAYMLTRHNEIQWIQYRNTQNRKYSYILSTSSYKKVASFGAFVALDITWEAW